MDAPFAQGEDNRLLDVIQDSRQPSPDSGLMEESLREEVRRALSTLSEREAQVIRLYFGLDQEHSLTLEEIGEKFNLTRERVRQIKEKAIRRLRHASRSKALRAYLG
jgi:RNA polymerase primary sigma factor